jgi:hypothetical protein
MSTFNLLSLDSTGGEPEAGYSGLGATPLTTRGYEWDWRHVNYSSWFKDNRVL